MPVISVTMKPEPEVITARISINMCTIYKNNSEIGEKMYRRAWNLDTQNVILLLCPIIVIRL